MGLFRKEKKMERVNIVGGGLAGVEAAHQLTLQGIPVRLYEMRPQKMTGAHKTLPLPSIVKVTNLENGKTAKLIINDRGPFINDRLIDVSKKAAEVLGFKENGIAKVRVEFLREETEKFLRKNKLK